MADFTTDDLDRLLARYPQGEIRATALALKACLADLDRDADPARQAALTEAAADLSLVLEHALREDGHGDEDYVNDDVFHAPG